MASNSILKLQVDDKQYEASLKNAQQGLTALQAALRNSGKSFADVDKQTEQYVRELGKMEATAKTTRGRIGEMSSAFVELSRIEKQLTDQERQSPVGKDLTESLAQLKQRTIDAKNELQGLENQIKNVGEVKLPDTGGLFSGDKLSGMLQVFGGNLMTKAAGAIASLGQEMYGMVQQGIEMAKQGEGIRIAFERLGRGDILDGLREATHGTVTDLELMKAAVKFNDFKLPLDELGTMLAFAQQKAKDTGQSVDYMVDSIVTGLGRKSLMILDNLGLSATEIRERMKETGDMTKAVGSIIRDQMKNAGDYVETAADRAAQANVSLQNKMEELGRKFGPVEEASSQLWTSMKIGILDIVGGPLAQLLNGLTQAGRMANAYGKMGGSGKVGRMTANLAGASEQNRQSIYQQQQQQFWRYINPREQQIRDIRAWQSGQRGEALQGRIGAIREKYGSLDATKIQAEVDAAKKMLADYQSAAKQILQPIKQEITPTITTSGGTTGGGGGSTKTPQTELQLNQTKINALTQEYVKLGDSETEASRQRQAEIQKEIQLLEKRNRLLGLRAEQAHGRLMGVDVMTGGLSRNGGFTGFATPQSMSDVVRERGGNLLDDKAMKAVNEDISRNLKEEDKRDDPLKEAKKQNQKLEGIGSDISGMLSGLEKMGIEIPEGLSSVVGGIQTISGIISSILTLVGVISALTSVKSVPIFGWLLAQGGIAGGSRGRHPIHAAGGTVVGNTYSGDQIPAMLNAGEVVLSKAQAGVIASDLEGGGMKDLKLDAVVTGEQIRMVLNNNSMRRGKGEYVTSNRR